MTQELFEEMIFSSLKHNDFEIFTYLFNKFPEMSNELSRKIENNINDIHLPDETDEEKKAQWDSLCLKIKKLHSEDISI